MNSLVFTKLSCSLWRRRCEQVSEYWFALRWVKYPNSMDPEFLSHMLVVGVVLSYMGTGTLELNKSRINLCSQMDCWRNLWQVLEGEYLGANLILGFMKFVARYGKGSICLQCTLRSDISLSSCCINTFPFLLVAKFYSFLANSQLPVLLAESFWCSLTQIRQKEDSILCHKALMLVRHDHFIYM